MDYTSTLETLEGLWNSLSRHVFCAPSWSFRDPTHWLRLQLVWKLLGSQQCALFTLSLILKHAQKMLHEYFRDP